MWVVRDGTRSSKGRVVRRRSTGGCQFLPPLLVTTTTRDTSKATSALNVSRHLLRAPPIHSQTLLPGPMHVCLNVDEIVRLVAYELVTSGGMKTAVALACCCKSLEDPVLDTLWERQVRLLPLLKSFPGDVWNDGACAVSAPTACVFPFH